MLVNKKIHVCLIQPNGYIHSLALLEAAEYVVYKLKNAGYNSELNTNLLINDGINIVFGAHITANIDLHYPENTILFNTEQLPENSIWTNVNYKKLLDRYYILDYSQTNIDLIPHSNKALVNFYHCEQLNRIQKLPEKSIDLLFYGSINERRANILKNLNAKGLRIQNIFGVYGAQRDELLAKSYAVLNLHYYEAQIFQQIRAFYPLINGIPVISENYPLESAPGLYNEVIFKPEENNFENYVSSLLSNRSQFESLAAEKLTLFTSSEANPNFESAMGKVINSLS